MTAMLWRFHAVERERGSFSARAIPQVTWLVPLHDRIPRLGKALSINKYLVSSAIRLLACLGSWPISGQSSEQGVEGQRGKPLEAGMSG